MNYEYAVEPSSPSVVIMGGLISLANKDYSTDLELTLAIVDSKKKSRAAEMQMGECRIASCYTYMQLKKNYYMRVYTRHVNKKVSNRKGGDNNESSLVYMGKINRGADMAARESQAVSIWANSFLLMHQTLKARGIPFFSFVQPNQYYPTARVMSAEEKAVAILENKNNEFQETIPSGYARILTEASKYRELGMPVYDATRIFDAYSYTLYADNCCHYNDKGNHILAEYIGKTMIQALEATRQTVE
ncbi:MAG: hypothetical protein R3E67_00700 [Pseudomonadales bacterium]